MNFILIQLFDPHIFNQTLRVEITSRVKLGLLGLLSLTRFIYMFDLATHTHSSWIKSNFLNENNQNFKLNQQITYKYTITQILCGLGDIIS